MFENNTNGNKLFIFNFAVRCFDIIGLMWPFTVTAIQCHTAKSQCLAVTATVPQPQCQSATAYKHIHLAFRRTDQNCNFIKTVLQSSTVENVLWKGFPFILLQIKSDIWTSHIVYLGSGKKIYENYIFDNMIIIEHNFNNSYIFFSIVYKFTQIEYT